MKRFSVTGGGDCNGMPELRFGTREGRGYGRRHAPHIVHLLGLLVHVDDRRRPELKQVDNSLLAFRPDNLGYEKLNAKWGEMFSAAEMQDPWWITRAIEARFFYDKTDRRRPMGT
jgi:hypothetical protein